MSYDIKEHKHRYAAWAASRASSVNRCRFNVRQGEMIIKHIGLNDLIDCPEDLPEPCEFDAFHQSSRSKAIDKATKLGLNFTHGVAAKLINIYMKTIFICGGYPNHAKTKLIHPPIDRLLLKSLLKSLHQKNIGKRKAVWHEATKICWSKFNLDQYEKVIKNICEVQKDKDEPLWKIEEHWQGYR